MTPNRRPDTKLTEQRPATRYGLDPDPLHVEPEPIFVRMRNRETADEQRRGVWLGGMALFELLMVILVVAIVAAIINLSPAPRSAPDPTVVRPGASGEAVAPGGTSAQAPVDASSQGLTGAPLSEAGYRLELPASLNTLDPRIGREGRITHMGRGGWPVEYLAIPLGPGHRVEICGPADCRVMVSTDAGPNRERILAGVIADVSWQRFETLCGVPASYGGCPGSWTVTDAITRQPLEGGRMTLPPTDVAP